ncbi:MAG TPA: hypothetical protein VIO94_06805, partial [Phenylobacterium sp.]
MQSAKATLNHFIRLRPHSPPSRRMLALLCLVASLLFAHSAWAAPASSLDARVSAAIGSFHQGQIVSARTALIAALDDPAAQQPTVRLRLLDVILEICVQTWDAECASKYVNEYGQVGGAIVGSLPREERHSLARRTMLYVNEAQMLVGTPEALAAIKDQTLWQKEIGVEAFADIRRRRLLANAMLWTDDVPGTVSALDDLFASIAALENSEAQGPFVAQSLVDAVATLIHLGDTDRAFGLWVASRQFLLHHTPELSISHVVLRITEARLLQEKGNLAGAKAVLDEAVRVLGRLELDPDQHARLLGDAMTLRAAVCVGLLDRECATASIAQHPLTRVFAAGARAPNDYEETTYLAARALVASTTSVPDATAAASLRKPTRFDTDGIERDAVEV